MAAFFLGHFSIARHLILFYKCLYSLIFVSEFSDPLLEGHFDIFDILFGVFLNLNELLF